MTGETRNKFLIPTIQQTSPLAISVEGQVIIKLDYEGSGKKWR